MLLNSLLVILCIFFGVVLFIELLLTTGKRKLSNGLLIVYLMIFSIQFIGHLFSYWVYGHARYSQYNSAFVLSSPALLYLHGNYLISKKKRFLIRDFFHFLPGLLVLLFTLNNVIFDANHRIAVYVGILLYAILSFKMVRDVDKNQKEETTQQDVTIFKWLKAIYTIFYFIFVLDAVLFFAFNALGSLRPYLETTIVLASIGFLFYMVSKFRTTLYSIHVFGKNVPLMCANNSYLEELNFNGSNKLLGVLKMYMEEHQPFLDPDLKIEHLSNEVNVSQRELSELINKQFGLNFISFINLYRMKMAIGMLKNPTTQDFTISEVMYAVGFNSKSVFNTTFKKTVGITPSEFRARNKTQY